MATSDEDDYLESMKAFAKTVKPIDPVKTHIHIDAQLASHIREEDLIRHITGFLDYLTTGYNQWYEVTNLRTGHKVSSEEPLAGRDPATN